MSMTIILPKKTSSIENLSNNINNQLVSNFNSKFTKREVKIYIPKFTFTSTFHLENVLPSMGMTDAFIPAKADFSGMSKGLSINAVIHKAFIEVNEKGTEAAAVTAVAMQLTSSIQTPKEIIFKADRPFIILITEKKTGSILFIGSVLNPNQH
jgi:serpin B